MVFKMSRSGLGQSIGHTGWAALLVWLELYLVRKVKLIISRMKTKRSSGWSTSKRAVIYQERWAGGAGGTSGRGRGQPRNLVSGKSGVNLIVPDLAWTVYEVSLRYLCPMCTIQFIACFASTRDSHPPNPSSSLHVAESILALTARCSRA